MKEIGGYIEFEKYTLPMLHEGAIALNCGRNCLAYLIRAKKIKKIVIPYFLCDSVKNLCKKENVQVRYYNIDESFMPTNIDVQLDEWIYIVNYYGQLTVGQIRELKEKFEHLIVDNSQAYFDMPVDNTDTLYTCRKFFGVSDGAFLYTDKALKEEIAADESFGRVHFLMGRFERSASEFYDEYTENNKMFANEPIKQMSKLTRNLLHGIDYAKVKNIRTENFASYHELLGSINQLCLKMPEGAFAYPLLIENGMDIRKELQKNKIYIPTLWPDIADEAGEDSLEARFAQNILPLPCDQRYDKEDIKYIADGVQKCIKN